MVDLDIALVRWLINQLITVAPPCRGPRQGWDLHGEGSQLGPSVQVMAGIEDATGKGCGAAVPEPVLNLIVDSGEYQVNTWLIDD